MCLFFPAEITSLVTDMHACADKIIDLFSGKTASSDGQTIHQEESLMAKPAVLCYVVKQALREAAVGESRSLTWPVIGWCPAASQSDAMFENAC